jgi:adenine-specific DNA-methyltransferase
LLEILGQENTTKNNQGYELTFAGKGIANYKTQIPTKYELKVENEQSKNFDNTNNIIIRGDNLDVLKILKQNYYNKIKMIYIDPPYNTQSDEFIYNDDFKKNEGQLIDELGLNEDSINYLSNVYGSKTHSGWLSFMLPRLKLARDLLKDDGVIFISIDDNEQANLKLLCDEVFGGGNFIASIPRKTRGSAKTQSSAELQKLNDYVICYWKNKDISNFNLIITGQYEYNYSDGNGKFSIAPFLYSGEHEKRTERPNLYYPIYYNKEKNTFSLEKITNSDLEFLPNRKNFDGRWSWSKKTFNEKKELLFLKENKIYIKNFYDENKDQNKYSKERAIFDIFYNSLGTKELNELFMIKEVFNNPKPTALIKHLLKICVSSNNNDIILDFFAGSGTTGDAVMQLNAEDGGNRQFILVQLDEIVDKKKEVPYNFIMENKLNKKRDLQSHAFISDITIERVNRAGNKLLNNDLLNKNLDVGYKVFSLVHKPQIEKNEEGQMSLQYVRKDVKNTLYNMMSAKCILLNAKIKEIEKEKLYLIDDAYFIVSKCDLNNIKDLEKRVYIDGYIDNETLEFIKNIESRKANVEVIY